MKTNAGLCVAVVLVIAGLSLIITAFFMFNTELGLSILGLLMCVIGMGRINQKDDK